MAFFDFLRHPDTNALVAEYRNTPGALLIDVRSPQEYSGSRIPDSINIPVENIDKVDSVAENKDVPLYVYCQSGMRSSQAISRLHHLGYKNAKNIGGIMAYSGKLEK